MAKSRSPGCRNRMPESLGDAQGRSALPEELRCILGSGCHRPHSHGQPAITAMSTISGRTRKNPKGLWRRTTIADYATAIAALGYAAGCGRAGQGGKGELGVQGRRAARPGETRCLISLSRGGGDAVVVREFDLKAKKLATDGFSLPEAKSDVAYLDDDTVLFGTDFGRAADQVGLCPHRASCGSAARRSRRPRCSMKARPSDVLVVAGCVPRRDAAISAW